MEQAMKDGEGCNIEGWLEVLRVAGNFHVSVHSQVDTHTCPKLSTKPSFDLGYCNCRIASAARTCLRPQLHALLLPLGKPQALRVDVRSRHCSQDFMLLGRAQDELATMRRHQVASGGALNPMVR